MSFFLSIFGGQRIRLFPAKQPPLAPVTSIRLIVTFAGRPDSKAQEIEMEFDPQEVLGVIQESDSGE